MLKSIPPVYTVSVHAALLFIAVFTANSLPLAPDNHISQSPIDKTSNDVQVHIDTKDRKSKDMGMKLLPTGSSLPDCTHACGACNPCKRVMVSFECSIAESCPVVYKCICKGKFYHVPSN